MPHEKEPQFSIFDSVGLFLELTSAFFFHGTNGGERLD
jgi:hypothetical protein